MTKIIKNNSLGYIDKLNVHCCQIQNKKTKSNIFLTYQAWIRPPMHPTSKELLFCNKYFGKPFLFDSIQTLTSLEFILIVGNVNTQVTEQAIIKELKF